MANSLASSMLSLTGVLGAVCSIKCTATHFKCSLGGIFASRSHLWKVLMLKAITTNETRHFEVSLRRRERETDDETKRKKHKEGETDSSPPYTSIHPHRSILQHELQGDVAMFVVLIELGRLPHLLCIGDPHPSTLKEGK